MSWQRNPLAVWQDGGEDAGDVIRIATFPDTSVYTLAGGAAVVWRLLAETMSRDYLLGVIAGATGVSPDEIAVEVDTCLAELTGLGLLIEA
ncbi:PqqD family peptide modification chaperone [Acidipropionibacterium acidipropionici]|uniref:PqqD family peptide modification chaperone n=1 Tax=Acidipropionibacterium acidipropionici TaxID=1748 RepID=UPI00110AB4F2|nr:PqqD family peptide modification chaperone [Acidipropionibacterium acidipropionici]QCV96061.1 PqqD family protein [Acidipropionibacterium acidipropionici]